MNTKETLLQKLNTLALQPSDTKALIGFDGYIDYIQKAVHSASANTRTYFDTITNFSTHVAAAAGKSAQIELRTHAVKMGGNAPIMSHALGSLGVENFCIGTLGHHQQINPVFSSMHSNCKLITIGASATSNALEFNDGKIILSEVAVFDEIELPHILQQTGKAQLVQMMRESTLLSFVDWANLPHCTKLWAQLLQLINEENVIGKTFFFDLCDPSKKTDTEINDALQVISKYTKAGTTVLGLNENEANKVYKALFNQLPSGTIESISQSIFNQLGIDVLMVHPVDCALAVSKEGCIKVMGHVVQQPKVLTGGGDNLNAGFCYALMNDFSFEEALLAAMGTSGAYVKNGYSPTVQELIQYIAENF
jgi:fructose-1-phosphate kinase PfkB-like protein